MNGVQGRMGRISDEIPARGVEDVDRNAGYALWLAHCRQFAMKTIRAVFLSLAVIKWKFGQIRGHGKGKRVIWENE